MIETDQAFWDQPIDYKNSEKTKKLKSNYFITGLGILLALGCMLWGVNSPAKKQESEKIKNEEKEPDEVERERLRKEAAKKLGSAGGKASVAARKAKKKQEQAVKEENEL